MENPSYAERWKFAGGVVYSVAFFHIPPFFVGCCAGRHVMVTKHERTPYTPGVLRVGDALLWLYLVRRTQRTRGGGPLRGRR
eukprot:1019237-Prymnesium_polylepis.1